jgi:hypothetical protein
VFNFYIKFVPRYFDCYLFLSYTFLDWIYLFIFIPQHLISFYFYIKFGPHFSQFYFFGSFLLIFFYFYPSLFGWFEIQLLDFFGLSFYDSIRARDSFQMFKRLDSISWLGHRFGLPAKIESDSFFLFFLIFSFLIFFLVFSFDI